jgi:NAD(P)H-dependent FMN reductase
MPRNRYIPGKTLRIVAVSGSVSPGNFTRRALEVALGGAAGAGAGTELIDLSLFSLPFCDERRGDRDYPPEVEALRRAVGSAHGIVLGSPEYHGSMSGALKNALDLMGSEEFEGKIVGLVGVAGGSQGAPGSLAHMRTVCRSMHAWVLPRQASIAFARKAFDAQGKLLDGELEERLVTIGREVARYARLHAGLNP